MAVTHRYIVERAPDQLRIAFSNLVKICQSKGIPNAVLVVPGKRNWEDSDVAKFLGADAAKSLSKGLKVKISDDIDMTLESTNTFEANRRHGLVVGVHLSLKAMNKLDDSWDTQAIMFLPWSAPEGAEWEATWHPENLTPGSHKPPVSNVTVAVIDALRELTQTINLGTGLSHPLDKKHAQQTIAKLRADGHSLDPIEIRRWAQRNGWSSAAASDLEKIARKP